MKEKKTIRTIAPHLTASLLSAPCDRLSILVRGSPVGFAPPDCSHRNKALTRETLPKPVTK